MNYFFKSLLSAITTLIFFLACSQDTRSQCVLFSEDFASSLGTSFTTSNSAGGSAWSFTNSCTASNFSGHSAPGSMVFQSNTVPCQFGNSTSTVKGNLNSPEISIASTGTTTLTFNYYLLNECTGTCQNDKLSVSISTDGGSTYTPIMDSYTLGGLAPTGGAWMAKSYNLTPGYGGQTIKIRFSFDSYTGTANAFDGVYIDDVVVTASAGPAKPANIMGSTWVCMNTSATYTTTTVTGATTYSWTVPAGAAILSGQGTTMVNIQFGTTSGNVAVSAVNTCGASIAKTHSVTVSVPQVAVSASSNSMCAGDTVQLTAISNYMGGNLVDHFDPTISTQWSSITGGVESSICGSVSGNALYFDGAGTRAATTSSLNVAGGGTINFFLKFGSSSAPCEDADAGENVALEYSIDGGTTWVNINTYLTTLYSSFTTLTENIPVGAQGTATRFRWKQVSHSGSGFDNWAIDDITITIVTAPGFSWSPSTSLSDPSINNPRAWPSVTTTYTVTTTNSCGTVSDSVTITVSPAVTNANAGPDVTICEGWNAMLHGSSVGGTGYAWSSGQTTASIGVTPSATTTYTMTAFNSGGCSGSDEVTVFVNPAPNAYAGSDFTICKGQTFMLNATGNGTYSWAPPAGLTCTNCLSPGANPTVTTTYTFTASNNCGTVSDEVAVTVDDPVSNAGSDITICPAGSVMLNGSGNGTYSWSPALGLDCTTCPNPTATPVSSTTYTLSVTNNCGTDNDEIVLTVDPSGVASASAGNDVTICVSDSTVLSGSGNGSYQWSPPTGLNCTTCANPVATPASTITYTLMVSGSCGNAEDSVTVTVDPCLTGVAMHETDDELMIVPNPGHGIFNVTLGAGPEAVEIEVVNVQGEIIYRKNGTITREGVLIDITGAFPGIYFLKATRASGTMVRPLLINNH